MPNVYFITQGEYSDFTIVSMWSSEEEAERVCKMLNAGIYHDNYEVSSMPLDPSPMPDMEYKTQGWKAFYNPFVHGVDVDAANVVFSEAIYHDSDESNVTKTSDGFYTYGKTQEKCLETIMYEAMY